jgi:hypothetical protein
MRLRRPEGVEMVGMGDLRLEVVNGRRVAPIYTLQEGNNNDYGRCTGSTPRIAAPPAS